MLERVRDDASLHDAIEYFFATEFSTDNALITEAVKRMLSAGGKRLRPRITLLAVEAAGGAPHDFLHLAAYMELIHVATLIHDDVVDNAAMRRGVNATAIDYGNRVSVLAGDYLFAWIFKNVTHRYPPPIPHILSATLADICDGEVLQLRALGDVNLPVSAYLDTVAKKTASLFAASAECGAVMGGGDTAAVAALRDFGRFYGIAFQMQDDVLDIMGDARRTGKAIGNDLRERKMTIPLILSLATSNGNLRRRVERLYGGDTNELAGVLQSIRSAGGVEASGREIARYAQHARRSLGPLAQSDAKEELTRMADELVNKE